MDISIKTVGHTRIYELENIVRETFKNVNIDFSDNSENKIISEMKGDTCYTLMIIDGKSYCGEYSVQKEKPYLNKPGLIINLSYADCYRKYAPFTLPWGVLVGIRPQKKVGVLRQMGYNEEEIKHILENDFLISPEKVSLMIETADCEARAVLNSPKNGVSLYIGIPFCPTRCSYCSFISRAVTDTRMIDSYIECIKREMEALSFLDNIETIYVGGGTPTTLNEKQLSSLLSFVNKNFKLHNLKEFTVEAGRPDTVNEEKLKIIYENNVDRISINPQTLNDKTLKLIGRKHTSYDFLKAYETARKFNFKTINTDLIAGLPEENEEDFRFTMDEIIKLKPENVTVHTLSIKRAADLDFKSDRKSVANEMQKYSRIILKDYIPYYLYRQKNTLDNLENVGYSLKGYECLYNIFMMGELKNVISFGGGGVTKLINNSEITRIRNPKDADLYIKEIENVIKSKQGVGKTENN